MEVGEEAVGPAAGGAAGEGGGRRPREPGRGRRRREGEGERRRVGPGQEAVDPLHCRRRGRGGGELVGEGFWGVAPEGGSCVFLFLLMGD